MKTGFYVNHARYNILVMVLWFLTLYTVVFEVPPKGAEVAQSV
jgi:hypothetical protein